MTKTAALRSALARIDYLKATDVLVNVGVGGIAFIGSVDHVLHLAREHGQTGHNAFAVAGTVEILAAYSGLEVRRRKGWSRAVPFALLLASIAFIMWANIMSTPDRTGTGITLALAAPSIFVAIMVIAETRHWKRRTRRKAEAPAKVAPQPVKAPQKAARTREEVRDEWFVRRTSGDPMKNAEIAALLGITVKSAGDARRRWEKALTTEESNDGSVRPV